MKTTNPQAKFLVMAPIAMFLIALLACAATTFAAPSEYFGNLARLKRTDPGLFRKACVYHKKHSEISDSVRKLCDEFLFSK